MVVQEVDMALPSSKQGRVGARQNWTKPRSQKIPTWCRAAPTRVGAEPAGASSKSEHHFSDSAEIGVLITACCE